MMDFCYKFCCIHIETYTVLHIFCLLTSMELIFMPNGSLLHLHSSDIFEHLLEKSYRHKYNDYIGKNMLLK